MNAIANLLAYRRPDGLAYHAVLTHNHLSADTRFNQALVADGQVTVDYRLPLENLHAVLRRVAHAIPAGAGVLVANDFIELAMLSCHDPGRTVIHMLHGDDEYYYDLAIRHEAVIDAYIAISRAIYDTLQERLPQRRDSIVYVPFGVPIPSKIRSPMSGPLRLLFAGRLENGQKGIFDLPEIDRQLREAGTRVRWTIVGGGPHEMELRRRWREATHVDWAGTKVNAEVLALYTRHDVFVLPTRTEGLPVALLEAMGAGMVPVVSDIASGVPEVVDSGITGFRPAVGDVAGFAAAIRALDNDRNRLETMSRAVRQVVTAHFDIRERVGGYQALYARWRELRRPRPAHVPLPYGSRLDQPWLPNMLVRAARSAQRWLRPRAR